MSTHRRMMVVVGVLIAVAAASMGALVVALGRPASVSPPAAPPQVLTLAASTTGNTITVVGVGIGSGTPNEAQLNLGVTVTRPNVRDAVTAAGNDVNKLVGALRAQGVKDKDMQTSSIYISAQTNCCPQTLIGYNAASSIMLTIHGIGGVTAMIEAAVDALGNDLQINGISLYVSDQGPMLKAARDAAMRDANTKAQDWARLSGHHVGGLVGVSEVVSTPSGWACDQCGGKGAGGGGIQVQPGVSSVTVTVQVTYELTS